PDRCKRLNHDIDASWIVRDVEDVRPDVLKTPGDAYALEMGRGLFQPDGVGGARRVEHDEGGREVRGLVSSGEGGAKRCALSGPAERARRSRIVHLDAFQLDLGAR